MKKYHNISIFGTSSDAGKSTITFVIAKILQNLGLRVAPFKAQNVSNNSMVCDDGGEIGVAQAFQAEVLNLPISYHFNPILLKIEAKGKSQIILEGKAKKSLSPREYYKNIDKLKPIVKRNFKFLQKNYDVVIAEGAGSPVELNLLKKDLSNYYIAEKFNTKIILVADIEKGGVFASIYGTYALLSKKQRKNLIGVIINKFRGDISLFKEGVEIIEKRFKIPVLGVIPYTPFNLSFEDSQSLLNYTQRVKNPKIRVAVIKFPKMSNFNDFEPLIADNEIELNFISSGDINSYDIIILGGTKSTIEDLRWLKLTNLFNQIRESKKIIFGICGGYQMLFKRIKDIKGVENSPNTIENGFNFFPDEVIFQKEKIVKKGEYRVFGLKVQGFEIHNGVSKHLYLQKDNIYGTFIHQIFDNDNFRNYLFKKINPTYKGYNYQKYKKRSIKKFITQIEKNLKIKKVIKNITI